MRKSNHIIIFMSQLCFAQTWTSRAFTWYISEDTNIFVRLIYGHIFDHLGDLRGPALWLLLNQGYTFIAIALHHLFSTNYVISCF